jgi:hypothetical protein
MMDFEDSRDVHCGREAILANCYLLWHWGLVEFIPIIRRLRHVDVIIGVNGFFATENTSQHLNSTVTDHLVGCKE